LSTVAIRRLRAFQLPLDEIAEVLRGDDAVLRERLAVQRARLEGRAVVTGRRIDELDRLLRGEEDTSRSPGGGGRRLRPFGRRGSH
jgi:hypothetical protein